MRKKLTKNKIYTPLLWVDVLERVIPSDFEYNFTKNVIFLPTDQRYSIIEMQIIIDKINILLNE